MLRRVKKKLHSCFTLLSPLSHVARSSTGARSCDRVCISKETIAQWSALLRAMVFHEIADGVYTFPRTCVQCVLCVHEIILTGARISVKPLRAMISLEMQTPVMNLMDLEHCAQEHAPAAERALAMVSLEVDAPVTNLIEHHSTPARSRSAPLCAMVF